MKLSVEIDLENMCFDQHKEDELRSIFGLLIEKVINGEREGSVGVSNGNTVGEWSILEEASADGLLPYAVIVISANDTRGYRVLAPGREQAVNEVVKQVQSGFTSLHVADVYDQEIIVKD